jgi:hypothetical protein
MLPSNDNHMRCNQRLTSGFCRAENESIRSDLGGGRACFTVLIVVRKPSKVLTPSIPSACTTLVNQTNMSQSTGNNLSACKQQGQVGSFADLRLAKEKERNSH